MKIIGMGLVAVLLFVLQHWIYAKFWDKNLHAFIFFAQTGISEGEEGQIVEVIENRKYLPYWA